MATKEGINEQSWSFFPNFDVKLFLQFVIRFSLS